MNYIKEHLKFLVDYIQIFFKWVLVATVVGTIGGIIGVLFHFAVDYVTELRTDYSVLIYFLPLGGLLIAAMYRMFHSKGKIDTNRVIESVREEGTVPFIMVPLIFISSVITHMFGGSAGREGAALQMGGGIGYKLGKILKFGKNDLHIITMAGMSSVFAALFGTPITAAVFSLEVISVGVLNYTGFLPCIIASVTAYAVSTLCNISPVKFDGVSIPALSADVLGKVVILSVSCAVLSALFCTAIKKCEQYLDKFIRNCYVRAFVGGAVIVVLTLVVNTHDYNGAGMDVIAKAVSGQARPADFALKLIFTAVTIAAGFKGGEIVPSLFIGSTFGCVMATLLGLDSGFCASIGMIALFCGAVNCPIASIFLSIEMFGTDGILFFAIACAVSYLMSGYSGLYKSQRIVYSKLTADYIDTNTK